MNEIICTLLIVFHSYPHDDITPLPPELSQTEANIFRLEFLNTYLLSEYSSEELNICTIKEVSDA